MAEGSEELPEPTSGLFLEVSFRRLLASCESIVDGSSTARPDLIDKWRRSPVFHHYVETLQEQLADLEASAGTRLPRPLLQRYAAHVDSLASQLQRPDMPAFCSAATAAVAPVAVPPLPAAGAMGIQQQQQQQQQQLGAGAGGAVGGSSAAAAIAGVPPVPPPRPAVVPPPVPVARNPQLPPAAAAAATTAAPKAAAESGPGGKAAGGPPPSKTPPRSPGPQDSRLQTQQQLHEDLTEELAGLAAQLKSNTLAMEGRLKEREKLLDSTETALDTSVQRTKESKERATQIHRRGRVNFCLTCLIMLVVGLVFAAMYVFIKLTRFAGYRAPQAVPAAAVPVPSAAVPGGSGWDGPADEVPVYEQHYDL